MNIKSLYQISFFLLVVAGAMMLAGCSTGVFLRPAAESGDLVKDNPACPGPVRVIQFTPKSKNWVHFRIYADPPVPLRPQTRLYVEVITQVGLGLPWSQRKSDEFNRRSNHKFEFRAEHPKTVLIYPDGRERVLEVSLFKGVHTLESKTILLARDYVELADTFLESFTIRMPSVFIDGEKIDIPPIRFGPYKETYMPVLNCKRKIEGDAPESELI